MSSDSVSSTLSPRLSGDNEQEVEEVSSGDSEKEVEEVSSGSSKQGCDEICSNEDGKEAIENSEQIVEKPKVGMIFDTQDEAYRYYSRYAQQMGFVVARRNLRKGKDGNVRHVCFECNRGGKAMVKTSNPVKLRPQTKCGCRARLNLSTNPDGKWKINRVALEHNHENSPGKAKFHKNYRVLDEHVKRKLLLNDKAGIKTYKTYD
ncbi:hypothetical protein C3L33_23393, partial [Rhododendron williamsianum]